MDLAAFIPRSFRHWPGKVSAVVFTPGCNFRCAYCHNYPLILYASKLPLISPAKFIEQTARDPELEGIVVTGGEPTLQGRKLIYFLRELKANGLMTRLETNGSNPELLAMLIENHLLDYIALDLKARFKPEEYHRIAGCKASLTKIKEAVRLVKKSGLDYEFRMTFVPTLHKKEDVFELACSLGAVKRFVLQQFNAASGTLDRSLEKIGLGSYDELLGIARELNCQAQEIRLKTTKGEEIITPFTRTPIALKKQQEIR